MQNRNQIKVTKQRIVTLSFQFLVLLGLYTFANRAYSYYFSPSSAVDDLTIKNSKFTTESSKLFDLKSKVTICDEDTDLNCDSTMRSVTPPDLSQFSYSLFALLASSPIHKEEDVESKKTDGNILVSPFSIASALALVLSGTTKNSLCETELQSTLSIASHKDLPLLSQTVLQSSSSGKNVQNGVQFTSANGIWVKESVKSDFVETAKQLHSAVASPLPTNFDPIDSFISQKTNGHISNMLQGPIDPLTRAILVNAVYFKGSWKEQFDPIHTTEGLFHSNVESSNNEKFSQKTKFMFASRKMKVGQELDELAGATMVLLDYENNSTEKTSKQKDQDTQNYNKHEFSALFILPPENNEKSMDDVIQSLLSLPKKSSTSLSKIIKQKLRYTKIDLKLPRFKVSWGVQSLKSYLKQLGIKSAFDANSKEVMFSEISNDPSLYLDDVYHKSVMEVSEEGTVAAAATVAVMKARSLPMPAPQITFNRPFIMIVLHVPTMTPLFITKITDLDNSF